MARDSIRAADESVLRDPKHRAAVVVLAAVLALDGADRTALGALAARAQDRVRHREHPDRTAGERVRDRRRGSAILPIGILTDRTRRTAILVVCIGIWCVAMGVAAAAMSFAVLFAARITLGVLSAAGGPPVTSLVGDLFPADVRGRVLGWVKSGELVGAGAGFLVAGVVVSLTSWRGVFVVLALMGIVVASGRSRAHPSHVAVVRTTCPVGVIADSDAPTQLAELVEEQGIEPNEDVILQGDVSEMPIRPAIGYVLHVRTVVMIIVASALGDVFFTVLRCSACCSSSTSSASACRRRRSSSPSSAWAGSWAWSGVVASVTCSSTGRELLTGRITSGCGAIWLVAVGPGAGVRDDVARRLPYRSWSSPGPF